MLEFDIQLTRSNFHMAVASHIDQLASGLFGPSGSGKSTLLSCLAGLTTPDVGRIVLNGRVLFDSQLGTNVPAHKRKVGIVFQDSLLLPHLSVKANLGYGIPKMCRVERRKKVAAMAEILDITHRLGALPGELSGGEKQRVALGRTLLAQPELALLDEPFSGLDIELKNALLPYLQELHTRTAVPIIIVSHDLGVIQYLADYVLMMDHGELLGQGSVYDLAHQASSQAFLETCGFNNTFDVIMAGHRPSTGMSCYAVLAQGPFRETRHLRIKFKGYYQSEHTGGQSYSASLSSRDIALALAPVDYISMQNQVPGYIRDVSHFPGKTVVCVDVGIRLQVDTTTQAIRDLGFHVGQRIWCLFKASALSFVPKPLQKNGNTGPTSVTHLSSQDRPQASLISHGVLR